MMVMSRRRKMMTGCLAQIKYKPHLARNKMTLGPSENFASSSRSSSADLSLVPEINIAISLNTLQFSFPIYVITASARYLYRLTAHLIGLPPLAQRQTFPQKAPCVTLLMCLTQLVPNESQICRALDVLQPICVLALRPFRPIYAFDQCVLCGSTSWAL